MKPLNVGKLMPPNSCIQTVIGKKVMSPAPAMSSADIPTNLKACKSKLDEHLSGIV